MLEQVHVKTEYNPVYTRRGSYDTYRINITLHFESIYYKIDRTYDELTHKNIISLADYVCCCIIDSIIDLSKYLKYSEKDILANILTGIKYINEQRSTPTFDIDKYSIFTSNTTDKEIYINKIKKILLFT